MLPNFGAHDSAWPPKPASGVRWVNFKHELSVWFAVQQPIGIAEAAMMLAASTQRTGAVAAGSQLPAGRVPFLIF
jgi:hypothetical protein